MKELKLSKKRKMKLIIEDTEVMINFPSMKDIEVIQNAGEDVTAMRAFFKSLGMDEELFDSLEPEAIESIMSAFMGKKKK